jgi:hypothetical protein
MQQSRQFEARHCSVYLWYFLLHYILQYSVYACLLSQTDLIRQTAANYNDNDNDMFVS